MRTAAGQMRTPAILDATGHPGLAPRLMHRFTVTELNRLGDSTGFSYRLPHLSVASAMDDALYVAEGRVQETRLRPGVKLVRSDIVTRHHYEATSERYPRLSVIVMLQGQASACVDRSSDVRLRARSGAIVVGNSGQMTSMHPAGQRMRSINVSLDDLDWLDDDGLHALLDQVDATTGPRLRAWSVPDHLASAIEQLFEEAWQGAMYGLLCEGVGLQVLASAMQDFTRPVAMGAMSSPRDRQRLERVRDLLYTAPGDDHTLGSLARVACMSPSSLRTKFQQIYHRSIFSWLRERRLEVARERLGQGWSVQQAAHFVGYRHASNFATAFRERYGITPSQIG